MPTPVELLNLEQNVDEMEMLDRVARLEKLMGLLLSDQAIGNVLKGPFRLPDTSQPSRAFQ